MPCFGGGKKQKLKCQATKKAGLTRDGSPKKSAAAAAAAAAASSAKFDPSEHSITQTDVDAVPSMAIGFATDLGFHHESNEDTCNVMEDLFAEKNPSGEYVGTETRKISLFSVFDGHGGPACSAYVKDKLSTSLASLMWRANYDAMVCPAYLSVFAETEKEFIDMCE
jgi:hypothetical protein